MNLGKLALLLTSSLLLASTQVRADEIHYSLLQSEGLSATNVGIAADGMPLISFSGVVPGRTYTISLAAYVVSSSATGTVTFPTEAIPVSSTPLTKISEGGDFAFTPSPLTTTFTGYATDPVPRDPKDPSYTGIPVGPFQPIVITFTVPPTLTSTDLFLSKISVQPPSQVSTGTTSTGITGLSSGTGTLVTITTSTTGAGTSVLTDTSFVQMSVAYNNTFKVITKGTSVSATNPGSFYYLAVGQTGATAGDFKVTVNPLPQDFVFWGANSVHAYLGPVDLSNPPASQTGVANRTKLTYTFKNAPANTLVLLTVHCQYKPKSVTDWATYLPKVYSFTSSFETVGSGTATTSEATMSGVLKR